MDEIATTLFFLSQEYLVSELQMEGCNGGEEEERPPEETSPSLNHLQTANEPSTAILHIH